jgi:uncharacterized protein YjbJ (UPF0337 family)
VMAAQYAELYEQVISATSGRAAGQPDPGRAEGQNDQAKADLKGAGEKVKDAFKK